jgi:serine/threonine protein kinase
MELLRGRSLREEIREGPVEPLRCTRIYKQICSALGEAHRQGVIHRDIKPSNIFMTGDESSFPKLLDFGLVKDVDGEGTELTKTGMVLGSPMYMSPEQVKSEKVSTVSDVYSLGMSMYHTLSGCTPFEGEFTAIMMAQILKMPEKIDVRMQSLFATQQASYGENVLEDAQNKETQALDSKIIMDTLEHFKLPYDIPEVLEWVIFTAIQKEPENRFSSVYQFRQALEVCEEVLIKKTENPDFNLTLSLDNGQLVRSDGKPITSDAEVSATMVFTPQKTKESSQKSNDKGGGSLMLGGIFALGILVVAFFSFYMLTEQEDRNSVTIQEEMQNDDKIEKTENNVQSEETKDKLDVRISSVPSGATVTMTDVNGEKMVVGNTPFLMSLRLSNIKFLEIEMQGYTSQKILPSLSNAEFEVLLEKIKKKTRKKGNKTKKNTSSKTNNQKEENSEKTVEENKSKTSSELKDPWD